MSFQFRSSAGGERLPLTANRSAGQRSNTFSELHEMRRLAFVIVLGAGVVAACGENPTIPPNPNSYTVTPPQNGSVSVRQDLTISLRDSGLVIVRNDVDTLPGNPDNPDNNPNPRLAFFVEDTDVALVNPWGVVRGLKPGTTNVTAVGFDTQITFTITVTPYTATSVLLRVMSRPDGTFITPASRTDTGTMWVLPADRLSSQLEGLILVGNDTVFCNKCNRKSPVRVQRLVTFRSLSPLASITQSADPFTQSTDNTPRRTDTTGRVLGLDTSSTPVRFVMESPTDDMADTVSIMFKLRPIDTLRIDADSLDQRSTNINTIGTVRAKYPNSDTTAGNAVQSTTANFAVRADYVFRVRRLNNFGATGNASTTSITILGTPESGPERYNVSRPIIEWTSALPQYLGVVANGINVGQVTARCAFVSTGCEAPSSSNTRNGLVTTCSDNGPELPGFHPDGRIAGGFPIQFSGEGTYSIPGCSPAKVLNPFPGATCNSANTSDLSAVCIVWVRGRTTDPATGKALVDLYRVNIRR
jgi:hypothetical protein